MNLAGLPWVFTAAVLLHNAEEALFLPSWSRRVRRWYRPVGNAEFRFAALVVSVAFVALTLAATSLPGAEVQYVFAGYVVAMLANALVPHLAITIALREYMPGTATAWLLVVPLGYLYLWTAVSDSTSLTCARSFGSALWWRCVCSQQYRLCSFSAGVSQAGTSMQPNPWGRM